MKTVRRIVAALKKGATAEQGRLELEDDAGELPVDLPARAEALLERLWQRFPMKRRPVLQWKKSLRVSAGMAYYRTCTIGLSVPVLTDPGRLDATLIHEYAHLLAFDRFGREGMGHGAHWQTAMREMGQEPIVRHAYEVTRNSRRQTVVYACRKCGKQFNRHRRLPKRRRYVHQGCGGSVAFVAARAITESEVAP